MTIVERNRGGMEDRVIKDGVWIESRREDSGEEEVAMAGMFLCVSVSFSQVD